MARLERELLWPCHWEEVYAQLVDLPPQNLDLVRAMKDVKDARLLRDDWQGGKRHVWLELDSAAKIPAPVLAIIPGGKLTWVQAGVWCPTARTLHIGVDPQVQNRQVVVTSRFALHDHPRGTLMHALLEVNARRIPFLGGVIEKLVITRVNASVLGHYEGLIQQMGG